MKKCVRCNIEKPKTNEFFYYRNKRKGWLSSFCIECKIAHRKDNIESELQKQRERRKKVRHCKQCLKVEVINNNSYCKPCLKELTAKKKKEDKCIYKSRLRKATPKWADKDIIRSIYKGTPKGHHVDHIVPIRGANVCGLHVPCNLQYLTAEENMVKSNRFCDGNHYSLEHNGSK